MEDDGQHEIFATAQAAWPGVHLDELTFRAFLAERTMPTGSAERAAELYLACACAQGDARAIALFETQYFTSLAQLIGRRFDSVAVAEDVMQIVRETLLVPRPGHPAGITGFTGAGSLDSWLRVVALRIGYRVAQKERRDVPLEVEHLNRLKDETAPEIKMLRAKYGSALTDTLNESLREALDTLPAAEQNLLRMRYIDGHGVDEIAAQRGVHRATAARWLVRAEEVLVDETLRRLGARLGTTSTEIRSVMRELRSRLPLSIRAVFEHR